MCEWGNGLWSYNFKHKSTVIGYNNRVNICEIYLFIFCFQVKSQKSFLSIVWWNSPSASSGSKISKSHLHQPALKLWCCTKTHDSWSWSTPVLTNVYSFTHFYFKYKMIIRKSMTSVKPERCVSPESLKHMPQKGACPAHLRQGLQLQPTTRCSTEWAVFSWRTHRGVEGLVQADGCWLHSLRLYRTWLGSLGQLCRKTN